MLTVCALMLIKCVRVVNCICSLLIYHGRGSVMPCHGNAMAMPWPCHGMAMALPWHGHSISTLFDVASMFFRCCYDAVSMFFYVVALMFAVVLML